MCSTPSASDLRRVCVFCGSSEGARPEHLAAAKILGAELADRGLSMVYGGARVGLMGAVARTVLGAGGEVVGVLPRGFAEKDLALPGLSELRIVGSLAERKAVMAERSDAFVALPGGFGTLDELSEMLVATQLGLQQKPCGALNVRGYWDGLLTWASRAVQEGFLPAAHAELVLVEEDPAKLLDRLAAWRPTHHQKPALAEGEEA